MTATIRLEHDMVERLLVDLRRPHRHAAERVGFLMGPTQATSRGALVLPTSYDPAQDDEYLRDDFVGARFSAGPIRRAMQHALTSGESCLHVHLHDHMGPTWFSGVDMRTTEAITRSLAVVCPCAPHGALVLSVDHVAAVVWDPQSRRLLPARVSVVGRSLKLNVPPPERSP